jgi:hypothetical protein
MRPAQEGLCNDIGKHTVRAVLNDEGIEVMQPVRVRCALECLLVKLVAFLPLAAFVLAGQDTPRKLGTWSGVLVTSACNADEAFAESLECLKNVPGAKVALYDDTNRVIYSLEPQEKITGHLGDMVTVRGSLDDETIRVVSIEALSIGLAVGQEAPALSLRDQFGRAQTLDTLKGTKGTVLLFFRSADW